MARYKVIDGDFKLGEVNTLFGLMGFVLKSGQECGYIEKKAYKSISIVSEHSDTVIIDAVLKDNKCFKAEISQSDFKILSEHVERYKDDVDYKLLGENGTFEKEKKSLVKLACWGFVLCFALFIFWGDDEKANEEKTQNIVAETKNNNQNMKADTSDNTSTYISYADREDYFGLWSITKEKSKIDDSENVYLSLLADKRITTKLGTSHFPKMLIMCRENKTSMAFDFGMFIDMDDVRVTYRVDDKKAKMVTWGISNNYEALYINNPIPFLKSILNSSELYIRFSPHGSNTVDANFFLTGLKNAIKPIQKSCTLRFSPP